MNPTNLAEATVAASRVAAAKNNTFAPGKPPKPQPYRASVGPTPMELGATTPAPAPRQGWSPRRAHPNTVCYHCGIKGHTWQYCRKLEQEMFNRNAQRGGYRNNNEYPRRPGFQGTPNRGGRPGGRLNQFEGLTEEPTWS